MIRDHRGNFQRAFAANFGVCTSYKSEILAAMLGLDMARSMNIRKLVLQMDNEACVQVIRGKEYQGGECHHLINHCRNLLACSDWEVSIIHTYREGNKVADYLANLGADQEERIRYFNSPPNEISNLLFADIMGVTTPRFVI